MPLFTYIKRFGLFAIVSSFSYVGYQIHTTYSALNTAIDTTVIDVTEPKSKKANISKKYVVIDPKQFKSQSPFDRFWDSLSFTYSRRLLNIAQSEDENFRRRAVDALAHIKTLDNWHYSILAHMIDARTAVGLARTENVDLKYFLKPPSRYVIYNHDRIVSWMKHFLISLDRCSKHPCMTYFINKAFINPQDVGRMVEHDISSVELKQCIQTADDILPLCVESILHHSTIENHARDIVQNNGLPLLMELYKRYKDNREITTALVKIIANISIYPELLQDVYRSGWVGILANLLKHRDIRISGPASRALINLDSDDHTGGKFERKLYLLHPLHRSTEEKDVDVIIVHGLLGGVFFTWRQRDKKEVTTGFLGKKKKDETITSGGESMYVSSDPETREFIHEMEESNKRAWDEIGKDFEFIFHDIPADLTNEGPYTKSGEYLCSIDNKYTQCWPKDWLPLDCHNLRIIGINYDTNLSFWAPMCPLDKMQSTLDDRSKDFIDKLIAAGVGRRPIIWLTHSMGGLLVKNILVKAWHSDNPTAQKLCESTKGIVFYSTPHKGTHAATLSQTTSLLIWPSIEVRELQAGSPTLLKLHAAFLQLLEHYPIKILSFAETKGTTITPLKLYFHFVPEHSAKLNIGEHYDIPLDHLGICKPINRHSFLYQRVVLFIDEILKDGKVLFK